MNVTLKPELEKLIADEVKAGRATGPDEFLNKAVYHYVVARDLGQEYTPEELDQLIAEGLDDIEQGDTIDGEEAFRHEKERVWLAANRDLYRGRWIALDGDQLLAAAATSKEVFAAVANHRPPPLVIQIASQQLPFAGW